jgi:hypothetical protein
MYVPQRALIYRYVSVHLLNQFSKITVLLLNREIL